MECTLGISVAVTRIRQPSVKKISMSSQHEAILLKKKPTLSAMDIYMQGCNPQFKEACEGGLNIPFT